MQRNDLAPAGKGRRRRKSRLAALIGYGLIAAFIFLTYGFEWLFPHGVPIGSTVIEEGLLGVPSEGWKQAILQKLALLQENERLRSEGRILEGAICIDPGDARAVLDRALAKSADRSGGGAIWVRIRAVPRFGTNACIEKRSRDSRTSFGRFLRIATVVEARPLGCPSLAFILNHRQCPQPRPAPAPLRLTDSTSYPEDARSAGAEGVATVEALLDPAQRVLKCSVIIGSGNASLDAAACGILAANARSFAGKGSSEGLASGVRRVRTRIRWELDKSPPSKPTVERRE